MKPPKEKARHYADKVRDDGSVSAVCYSKPRAIPLSRASWTLDINNVTCHKCLEVVDIAAEQAPITE